MKPSSSSSNRSSNDNQRLNWCCTMYPDSWDSLDECYETLNEIADDCKYAIFGNETCPTTGRHHLQGYVMFKTRIRFSALRKNISLLFIGKLLKARLVRTLTIVLKTIQLQWSLVSVPNMMIMALVKLIDGSKLEWLLKKIALKISLIKFL